MVKRALITGIAGQDGSYLAELLLNKGYEVHGVVRRFHLQLLLLHYGDLLDDPRLSALLAEIQPDEIYHLAAQSHVRVSFDEPECRPNRRIDIAGGGVRNSADRADDAYAGECPADQTPTRRAGKHSGR